MGNKIKILTSEDYQHLMTLSFCQGIEECCKIFEMVANDNCIILATIKEIRLGNLPKIAELRIKLEDHKGLRKEGKNGE